MTFMSLFWPLLVIISGFSLMKYVKHLEPVKVKTTTAQDRKRILVLSTLTAFLRTEGQPAAYHSHTGSGSRNSSQVQFSLQVLIQLHIDAFELFRSCYRGTSFICLNADGLFSFNFLDLFRTSQALRRNQNYNIFSGCFNDAIPNHSLTRFCPFLTFGFVTIATLLPLTQKP